MLCLCLQAVDLLLKVHPVFNWFSTASQLVHNWFSTGWPAHLPATSVAPSPKEDGDDETEWKEEDEEALRKQAFDMQYSMFADQGYRDPRMKKRGAQGMLLRVCAVVQCTIPTTKTIGQRCRLRVTLFGNAAVLLCARHWSLAATSYVQTLLARR